MQFTPIEVEPPVNISVHGQAIHITAEPAAAPEWLIAAVRRAKRGQGAERIEVTRSRLSHCGLSTVCETARCPNRGECFSKGTATFLILGEVCTRGCTFCAVPRGRPPEPPDEGEPERLARAVRKLRICHAVITSVTRDDLPDGGSLHYARVVDVLRRNCAGVTVELLAPDFRGSPAAIATVLASRPDIFAHNIETVRRLHSVIRKGSDYRRSLRVLEQAKQIGHRIVTKSSLMLGLGEERREVEETLVDMREAGCDMLTLGQYLAPSISHTPVTRYVTQDEFDDWNQKALKMGFRSVVGGPLVRSSYEAAQSFEGLP